MNRKGKNPLTRAIGAKAGSKRQVNQKGRGLFNFKGDSAGAKNLVKSKRKKAQAKAIVDNNPRLKPSLAAKKNPVAKSGSAKKNSLIQPKKPRLALRSAIYAITIAVGLSTILGTLVSIAGSFKTAAPDNSHILTAVAANSQTKSKLDDLFAIASLGKELITLKSNLQQLAARYPDLEPEIFIVDLDTKGFVSIKGDAIIAAASTIKLPILVAFFQDVDQGKIKLEEPLTITEDVIAEGSGNMQYEKAGTKFSALETADKMMTISDNTATNMLIKRLGGMEQLNQRFDKMGLKATRLRNPLPDLTGTNTTTPEDLGNILVKIDNGNIISSRSRDRLLYIMRNIVRNTLLPEGLESNAIIAHKTGDIKPVLGDVGIIDMPSGKRYIASMLVKRPDNSLEAKEFIQEASRTTYQYFKNSQTSSFTVDR
ncbi:MAG TPA: serine hydrolase [Coleofasciculaceae cyanobacterium]